MNLDNLNKWLSVFANIGVLIGIAVVVIEINQNTTAIETDTAWSRAQWILDFNTPRGIDSELAALETKYRSMSEEELLALDLSDLSVQAEFYRLSVRVNMERIYQETRFLTRTSPSERRAQRNQLLRECYPYIWIIMESIGYGDVDPEFAEFLQGVVQEIKSEPCTPLDQRLKGA